MNNNVLLDLLLSKIASIMYEEGKNSDETSFISWLAPGIPFQSADLQFAVKGINGADVDETRNLIRTASEFSRQVNTLPSSDNGIFSQNDKNLVDIYSDILRFSKVPKDEITKEEEEKINHFRKMLFTTKKVKDIVDGTVAEKIEDSPMSKSYKEREIAYQNALMLYNNKRIAAMSGTSQHDVQDFALNGELYRLKVKNAMDEWVSKGYKNDYEKINAYINQVSRRSMGLLKAELLERFEKSTITDPTSSAKFYLSLFYPGNFINTDDGWTKFGFTSKDLEKHEKESKSSTSGSVGLRWGLFSGSASGGYSKEEKHMTFEQKDFSMNFKITQVMVNRPWFSLDFITNNLWNWDATIHRQLCNGEKPPHGQMIGFPTVAVFIKDLEISSASIKESYDEIQKTIKAGGRIGWGPFRFGATHNSSSKDVNVKLNERADTLSVSGMQLIAFKNFRMPKTPNCVIADDALI